MTLTELNALPDGALEHLLSECCVSQQWITKMVNARPFTSRDDVHSKAVAIWQTLDESDYLEAFKGHPQIGDIDTLREKYHRSKATSETEQAGMNEADEATLKQMIQLNRDYLNKFGFIFIVCATGKTAEEMRTILAARITHSRDQELNNAANEQEKITALRLEKHLC